MNLVGNHQREQEFGGHIGHGSGKQAPGVKGHQRKSVDGKNGAGGVGRSNKTKFCSKMSWQNLFLC